MPSPKRNSHKTNCPNLRIQWRKETGCCSAPVNILVSQEWLTTIAGWKFVSGPKPGSGSESRVTPAGSTKSYVLNMRNGLPYLSKELFWLAMEDVSKRAELLAGHSWRELKEMLDNCTHETHPQIYSVKTVEVLKPPEVVFTMVPRTQHFVPTEVRKNIMAMFDRLRATPNANRGRLSDVSDVWCPNRKRI